MAKCPNCGFSLKPWHVKAECPKCQVNIPNYDWEARLEKDSEIAEAAYKIMRERLNKFKYAMVGNKLRIARIPVSFLPLGAFFLPLFTATLNLPFNDGHKTYNIITIIQAFMKFGIGGVKAYIHSPVFGDAALKLAVAALLVAVSALTLLFSLFFFLFNYKNFHSLGLFITNLIGALCMAASGVFYSGFLSVQQASTVNAFSGKIGFGLILSVVLFLASSGINFVVSKSEVNVPPLKDKKLKKSV